MTNPEQIPSEIFDWLMQSSFEELQPAQQQFVLCHLTADAYNQMHHAAAGLRTGASGVKQGHEASREKLLAHFDTIHPPKHKNATIQLRLWRAAAILMLLLSTAQAYLNTRQHKMAGTQLASKKANTIFVTKLATAAPVIKHDTIYLPTEKNNTPVTTTAVNVAKTYTGGATFQVDHTIQSSNALTMVSVDDYNKDINALKGNSIQNDSLVQQFHFVSL